MRRYKGSKYNYFQTNDKGELLIMNMRTEGKVKATEDEAEAVKELLDDSVKELDETKECYTQLIKNGMLVREEEDEVKLLMLKQNEMIYGTDTLSVTIMPTNDCDFRCSYCYENHIEDYMDEATEERVLLFLEKKIARCKQLRLAWFGGEALLCKERVLRMSKKINEMCRRYKVPIYGEISTNGYNLDVDTFKELVRNHITEYQICIDGPKQCHNQTRPHCTDNDSYTRIVENLMNIRDKVKMGMFKISLRTNITPGVRPYLDEHIEEMKRLFGDDHRFILLFQCVRDWGGDHIRQDMIVDDEGTEYDDTYKTVNEVGMSSAGKQSFAPIVGNCAACRKNGYVIDFKGELHKCSLAYHSKEYREVDTVGYINEMGEEIVDESKLARWIVNNDDISKGCYDCVLFPFCMGGHCPYSRNITKTKTCNKYILSYLSEHVVEQDKEGKIPYWN